MEDRVFVHTISVKRPGEKHSFQVKVPRDAKVITGIELTHSVPPFQVERKAALVSDSPSPLESLRIKGFGDFRRNYKIGFLKLESNDKSGLFHADEIIHSENNFLFGNSANYHFAGTFWEEGTKMEILNLNVNGENTVISGYYEDIILSFFKVEYQYSISLYLYYDLKKKKNDN